MNHNDHLNLIRDGVVPLDGVWADLGSGGGAFTLALADLLSSEAEIFSVDKDRWALRRQRKAMSGQFPHAAVTYLRADYTQPLQLPPLDGLLLANTLHFHPPQHRQPLLQQLRSYLKPTGRLLMIEYNTTRGNRWVPHPFTFAKWQSMAADAGFTATTLLATRPSRFLGEIFSAVSLQSLD